MDRFAKKISALPEIRFFKSFPDIIIPVFRQTAGEMADGVLIRRSGNVQTAAANGW